jgi:hypothetical protein
MALYKLGQKIPLDRWMMSPHPSSPPNNKKINRQYRVS